MGCLLIIVMVLIILDTVFGVDLSGFMNFVSGTLSSIGSFLNSAFLAILSFFQKIFSVFDFIGDAFDWLLTKLGGLLAPVLEALPDSPVIPLMVCVLLGVLFMALKRPGDDINAGNIDKYVRPTYAWIATSFTLGMFVAGTGNPLGAVSGFISSNASKPPMTLLNYSEWAGFARTMLNLTIIGGLISSLIFASSKGLRSFIRTWVGLAFCGMLGYEYMTIRLVVCHWMAENLSFIGGLINIAIGFAEFFIPMQVFFGFLAFLLPGEAIAAIAGMTDSNESADVSSKKKNPFDNVDTSAVSKLQDFHCPDRVLDDQGNTWEIVHSDSEKAEYRSKKTGARKTVWATGGYLNLPSGWREA